MERIVRVNPNNDTNGVPNKSSQREQTGRFLRNIVYDIRVLSEWSIYLPFVQRIMSTGVRPCVAVFGRDLGMEVIQTADGEDSSICVLQHRDIRESEAMRGPDNKRTEPEY